MPIHPNVPRTFQTPITLTLAAAILLLAPLGRAASHEPKPPALESAAPALVEFTDAAPADGQASRAKKGDDQTKPRKVKASPELKRNSRVSLDLPNGRTIVAVRQRLDDLGGGDFVWNGEVEGHPFSRVTLTSRMGTTAGVVDLPWVEGSEYFLLQPQEDGGAVLAPVLPASNPEYDPLPWGDGEPAGEVIPATAMNPAVVSVLVPYSTTAKNANGGQAGIEAKILTAIGDANNANRNSQVHIVFNLVHMVEVDDTGTTDIYAALNSLQNPADGVMDEVHALRDLYQADVVSLVGAYNGAGLGYVMTVPSVGFESVAFSAVSANYLWYFSLHHEVGHNLGSGHDRAHTSYSVAYPFAYGYQNCTAGFRDIMSYYCDTGYATRVNYLSNPNVLYDGLPFGISHEVDPLNSADNARSMNLTGPVAQQFRAGPFAPAPPSSLFATLTSGTTARLFWLDNSANEAGFRLERSSDQVTWSVVAMLAANLTTFDDSGLTPEATYFYRLRAYNGGGFSPYSNTASVVTTTTAPAAPSGLDAVAPNETLINLTWTDHSGTETGFRIERAVGAAAWSLVTTLPANTDSWSDLSVTVGVAHAYRVRSYNAIGESAWSNTASATPTPPPAPAAPSGLTITAVSQTQVNLAWSDNADDETGQQLERSLDNGVTWAPLASVEADVTTYVDSGLTPATAYGYRVRAGNSGGFSAFSAAVFVTTPVNPPAAPTGLTATPVSATRIDLAWVDNADNETGFNIERSLDLVTWAVVGSVGANQTTFAATGLNAATTYSHRVMAVNSGGISPPSSVATAATLPNPPAAPTDLTATAVSQTQVNLAWMDNADNETSQQLERSLDNGATWAPLASVETNVTTYVDSGLAPATTYAYRVRAGNSGGLSAFSAAVFVTTPLDPPAAPTGLTATPVSQTQIDLAWVDNADNETGFNIERSLNLVTWAVVGSVGANQTTFAATDLNAATTYYHRVMAVNAGGNSTPSSVATAATWPNPPAAPTSLTATAVSQTQVNLAWTDNDATEAGFRVESSVSGGPWFLIATLGANQTSFQNTGLSENTSYSYRVQAYGQAGNSAWSNVATATTPAGPTLNPPLNLTAIAVSHGIIDLAWTDNNTIEQGFEIRRSTDGQNWSLVARVAANASTYRDAGLAPLTTYTYRVWSFAGASLSAAFAEAGAATPAYTPPTTTGTYTTVAAEDGYALESSETSNLGGSISAGKGYVGDSSRDYQYKSIFSFDTSGLPDGATITSAQLRLYASSVSGTWPWQTHGDCLADVKTGTGFGGTTALAKTDFEAAADATGVATLSAVSAKEQWSQGALSAAGLASINTTGKTQFRVYFQSDDNDDAGNDYVIFSTGGASTPSLRPQLIVTYQTSVTAPAAPTSLVVKPVSVTQLGLTWVDNSANETGFRIERSLDGANWVEIALLAANTTAFTDAGLVQGTTYSYRVRSYNDFAQSAYSAVASGSPSNPPIVLTRNSIGTEDGYVLESGENTSVGGSIKAGTAYVGDGNSDKQYRSVFSFDTSALPDNAVIVAAKLRFKVAAFSGTAPWQILGSCLVDVKGGTGFGGSAALATGDFSAAADSVAATSLSAAIAVGQWSEGNLSGAGLTTINKTGKTQFRVYFQQDDNDDNGNDYVSFSAGGASTGSKPELVIEYTLP